MLLSSPKARLITFFQDLFNEILSQNLTHDRSHIYQLHVFDLLTVTGEIPSFNDLWKVGF